MANREHKCRICGEPEREHCRWCDACPEQECPSWCEQEEE